MPPYDEQQDDRPEWEIEDEKIPPSLDKKWKEEERQGLKAGVCDSCRYPFTKDQLTCNHCGKSVEMAEGVLIGLKNWLIKKPLGLLFFILILLGIIGFLVL